MAGEGPEACVVAVRKRWVAVSRESCQLFIVAPTTIADQLLLHVVV